MITRRSSFLAAALFAATHLIAAADARAETVTLTSALRSVQANAETHSVTSFGDWSDAVASGQTNASQTSTVSTSNFSINGSLHAHWPFTNSASTKYEVSFTAAAAMNFDLSGSMFAMISSFGFAGPGWSKLSLVSPNGPVFSYVIEAFSGGPSSYELDASGTIPPGIYTLTFEASGTGFGSSLMTSGVSDASYDVHLTLVGLCGSGSGGSCFVAQSTPSCSDPDCCGLVCTVDPFCCEVAWDALCVNEAFGLCSPPCPADVDQSGAVDAADLGVLLGAWGSAGIADLDLDGTVGASDLGVLLGAWGPCS